jgi:hypothetical protein
VSCHTSPLRSSESVSESHSAVALPFPRKLHALTRHLTCKRRALSPTMCLLEGLRPIATIALRVEGLQKIMLDREVHVDDRKSYVRAPMDLQPV